MFFQNREGGLRERRDMLRELYRIYEHKINTVDALLRARRRYAGEYPGAVALLGELAAMQGAEMKKLSALLRDDALPSRLQSRLEQQKGKPASSTGTLLAYLHETAHGYRVAQQHYQALASRALGTATRQLLLEFAQSAEESADALERMHERLECS